MIQVTWERWNSISKDYKGVWTKESVEWRGDIPKEYIGKRNILAGSIGEKGTGLLTEGVHFEII